MAVLKGAQSGSTLGALLPGTGANNVPVFPGPGTPLHRMLHHQLKPWSNRSHITWKATRYPNLLKGRLVLLAKKWREEVSKAASVVSFSGRLAKTHFQIVTANKHKYIKLLFFPPLLFSTPFFPNLVQKGGTGPSITLHSVSSAYCSLTLYQVSSNVSNTPSC